MSRSHRTSRTPGGTRRDVPATTAGPHDMFSYWLMPHGLLGLLTTVFRTTAGGSRGRRVRPGRTPYPGPRLPFPVLAPGKVGRAVGEHTFWRGSLWNRTLALQGDSTFTKFDLFELAPSAILYWGTFRGNGFYGSEESHSFSLP